MSATEKKHKKQFLLNKTMLLKFHKCVDGEHPNSFRKRGAHMHINEALKIQKNTST